MNANAHIYFHDTLNDFLPATKKYKWINYSFTGSPALKDAIEALGIPHPEVDVILVNQQPASLQKSIQAADKIEVYPATTAFPELRQFSIQDKLPVSDKFILDVHLGKLAKSLRLLGFDTYFDVNIPDDKAIAAFSNVQNRIVLTRDIGLLKHKEIRRGYWLRSQNPKEQLHEVIRYFQLQNAFKPFTRCLACNNCLAPVAKEKVWDYIPPKTKLYYNEFYQCPNCARIYWQGSHYDKMKAFIQDLKPAQNN